MVCHFYFIQEISIVLILMPATRNIFLHLNKCVHIKDKIQKKIHFVQFLFKRDFLCLLLNRN
ncbi:hypothetical protein FOS06_12270 [Niallia circulans]|nr:hypothetical protein [Niallia circulans]